jgi:hypothetical protein
VGHKDFGSLLTTDCTNTVAFVVRQPDVKGWDLKMLFQLISFLLTHPSLSSGPAPLRLIFWNQTPPMDWVVCDPHAGTTESHNSLWEKHLVPDQELDLLLLLSHTWGCTPQEMDHIKLQCPPPYPPPHFFAW